MPAKCQLPYLQPGSLELNAGIIADMWGALLKRDHKKGDGFAFCGFLYQAIGTMSSYDNAQKARADRKLGEK